MDIARTPPPPYVAVIFTSKRSGADAEGYARMAQAMADLSATQDGFLGIESARDAEGFGITVSYWRDEASIAAWKRNSAHLAAQRGGHERWYDDFSARIARVERAYTRESSSREGL